MSNLGAPSLPDREMKELKTKILEARKQHVRDIFELVLSTAGWNKQARSMINKTLHSAGFSTLSTEPLILESVEKSMSTSIIRYFQT